MPELPAPAERPKRRGRTLLLYAMPIAILPSLVLTFQPLANGSPSRVALAAFLLGYLTYTPVLWLGIVLIRHTNRLRMRR